MKILKMISIGFIGFLLAIILIITFIIGSFVFFEMIGRVANNDIANEVENTLRETPLPEETELLDSVSMAGKLVGNGNGMQYFGAILLESELSLEELNDYYSEYRQNEW